MMLLDKVADVSKKGRKHFYSLSFFFFFLLSPNSDDDAPLLKRELPSNRRFFFEKASSIIKSSFSIDLKKLNCKYFGTHQIFFLSRYENTTPVKMIL